MKIRVVNDLRIATTPSARFPQPVEVALADFVGEAQELGELVERDVEASEVREFPWGRFVFFADPDGLHRLQR